MRNERQALAVTLGLLLLVGCTLLLRELTGVWAAFAVSCGLTLAGYAAPGLARELTVRRYARRLRRALLGRLWAVLGSRTTTDNHRQPPQRCSTLAGRDDLPHPARGVDQ
ncbi:hypothetical protein [Streptomyces chrestomyceticus]|uniref:hypothetical protein n=1 Tax=Streptomyces chrestomyceticus TaxID=68185 RepID=UPI0035A8BDC1